MLGRRKDVIEGTFDSKNSATERKISVVVIDLPSRNLDGMMFAKWVCFGSTVRHVPSFEKLKQHFSICWSRCGLVEQQNSQQTMDTSTDKENSKAKAVTKTPWVEAYRPKTLEDVVGNEDTILRLRAIAKDGNLPNLIVCGPPGTGKTTSVHALARELLGKSYKEGVLELNASDARGIDVVRNRIKSFAMSKVTLPPGRYVSATERVDLSHTMHFRHKIIILDEADSMTTAAQQALRRTMEIFSNTTRFCLACNISTKIIEAIQSRAAILRFSKLSHEEVLENLLRVCKQEQVAYTDEGLQAILFTAEGDMRHALNTLQASVHLTKTGLVNETTVYKVCDQPHPKTLGEILDCCRQGDTKGAVDRMSGLYRTGYSSSDIIGTIFKVAKAFDGIPEALKLEYLREIGFAQMRVSDGVNSLLQLLGLVSRLSLKSELVSSKTAAAMDTTN